jgi:hypothetical protein
MNDAPVVRGLERGRELPRECQGLVRRKRSGPQAITQRRSFDELQHEEPQILELLDTMNCRDARMIEGRQDPRLPFETCEPLRVGGQGAGQYLYRDLAAELCVPCPVNLAHAPAAQDSEHVETAEAVSSLERRRWRVRVCMNGWSLQEATCGVVRREEILDFAADRLISFGFSREECRSLRAG